MGTRFQYRLAAHFLNKIKYLYMVSRAVDIQGKRYGSLTVVGRTKNNYAQAASWLCRCDCGGNVVATGNSLRMGNRVSCGCNRHPKTHGKSKTHLYKVWRAMLNRCNNPNVKSYSDYGGRGIKVCDRWALFETFLADMGERPSDKHQIDRIDNDGNYCPENCQWVTRDIQVKNKRNNHFITANGETLHLSEWARRLGCANGAILARIHQGMDEVAAVTKPIPERPNSKLTMADAEKIRAVYPTLSAKILGVLFFVSDTTVLNIVNNKIFKAA